MSAFFAKRSNRKCKPFAAAGGISKSYTVNLNDLGEAVIEGNTFDPELKITNETGTKILYSE